jgi:hypothetical protein
MGTAMRNPGQMLGMLCESSGVLAGAVLVQGSANDSVKLPTGANSAEKFVGIAYQNGLVSTTQPIPLVINGVWSATASGAITRGSRLVIGGALGTVSAETYSTPASATRIGIALESGSDGDVVAVLIGADTAGAFGTVIARTASGAIVGNRIVIAGNSVVTYPAGASPTGALLGVSLNSAADGETVYVCTSGVALVTDSGSGVTANDFITSGGATGLGLTAAPGAGTNCGVVGIALNTTAASGSIAVDVAPSRIQG